MAHQKEPTIHSKYESIRKSRKTWAWQEGGKLPPGRKAEQDILWCLITMLLLIFAGFLLLLINGFQVFIEGFIDEDKNPDEAFVMLIFTVSGYSQKR